MKEMKKIGAMWTSMRANKVKFYGTVNGVNFLVFENKNREKPSQPDYIIVESTSKKEQDVGVPF